MLGLSSSKKEPVKEEEKVEDIPEYDDRASPVRPEYTEFDDEDHIVDLRAFSTTGGIFHFDLLHLPPQPRLVNTWIMRQRKCSRFFCICINFHFFLQSWTRKRFRVLNTRPIWLLLLKPTSVRRKLRRRRISRRNAPSDHQ